MNYPAQSPKEYLEQVPKDRQSALQKLRDTINTHIPRGFEETMTYGMIGWVVPHTEYPAGYHVNPRLPLPFISIASQKNFIGLYHMGVYTHRELLEWFVNEYPNHSKRKLDMGKSCIRFKNIDQIPYELIGQLVSKLSVDDWVGIYERNVKR